MFYENLLFSNFEGTKALTPDILKNIFLATNLLHSQLFTKFLKQNIIYR